MKIDVATSKQLRDTEARLLKRIRALELALLDAQEQASREARSAYQAADAALYVANLRR